MKKKNAAVVCVMVAILSVLAFSGSTYWQPPHESAFTDVSDGAWYEDAVQYVYERGFMKGVGDNLFAPGKAVTRGMLVTILYRMEGAPQIGNAVSFQDILPDSYYADAVRWAAGLDIVKGYDVAHFGPEDHITREQLTAILYRHASSKGIQTDTGGALAGFEDADEISAYAREAMRWAYAEDILLGGTDTTIDPRGTATRAQAAAFIMRYDTFIRSAESTPAAESVAVPSSKPYTGGSGAPAGPDAGEAAALPDTLETEAPTLSVSSAMVKPGEKNAAVTISIQNNPGVLGMTLSILYDDSIFTIMDAENGDAFDGVLQMTKPGRYASQCRFVWDGQELASGEEADGTALVLRFDVSDAAAEGVYPIALFYNDGDIVDNDLASVYVEVRNGYIRVVP